MSCIENVSVGEYITVTSDVYRPEQFRPSSFEYEHVTEIRRIDPEPLRVVAISAPFILCERIGATKGSISVDCRHVQWTKVNETFVREFCRLEKTDVPDDAKTDDDKEQEKETSKRMCPLCAERMSERRGAGKNDKWLLTCDQCQMQFVPIRRAKR